MRQRREGGLSLQGERQARRLLRLLAGSWSEVRPSELLRSTAERLLAAHLLRAADAFQLAAALQWCQRHTTDRKLVTFDLRLREAAREEGFTILPSKIR